MSKTKKEVKTEDDKRTVENVIVEVLSAYMQQELGNKVTQFSLQGLSDILVKAVQEVE